MAESYDILADNAVRQSILKDWQELPRGVRIVDKPSAKSRLLLALLKDLESSRRSRSLRDLAVDAKEKGVGPLALVVAGWRGDPSSAALQGLAVFSTRYAKTAAPYVAPTLGAFRRIVLARLHGAEKHLVASASVDDGLLTVWSCEPKLYQCEAAEIPALAELSEQDLGAFEVSEIGNRIHWEKHDIDISLDTVREIADPSFRKRNERRAREEAERYAKAIKTLRKRMGITQKAVKGLSERQIRRLEAGGTMPEIDTLRKLASAHGMTIDEYLKELARESQRSRRSSA